MAPASTRAGRYVKQRTGYAAFIPAPLPPDPPVALEGPPGAPVSRGSGCRPPRRRHPDGSEPGLLRLHVRPSRGRPQLADRGDAEHPRGSPRGRTRAAPSLATPTPRRRRGRTVRPRDELRPGSPERPPALAPADQGDPPGAPFRCSRLSPPPGRVPNVAELDRPGERKPCRRRRSCRPPCTR